MAAREGPGGRLIAVQMTPAAPPLVLALALLTLTLACGRQPDNVSVTLTLEPPKPVAGAQTTARLSVQTSDHQPLRAANLRLEAHMTHPGMAPLTIPVSERADGVYEGRLQLSMAGDWQLVVTGTLPDGSRLTREFTVSGVTAAGQ